MPLGHRDPVHGATARAGDLKPVAVPILGIVDSGHQPMRRFAGHDTQAFRLQFPHFGPAQDRHRPVAGLAQAGVPVAESPPA